MFWSVKCFAQLCRIDPDDFLKPHPLILQMIYNMSLCNFFHVEPRISEILQGYLLSIAIPSSFLELYVIVMSLIVIETSSFEVSKS